MISFACVCVCVAETRERQQNRASDRKTVSPAHARQGIVCILRNCARRFPCARELVQNKKKKKQQQHVLTDHCAGGCTFLDGERGNGTSVAFLLRTESRALPRGVS